MLPSDDARAAGLPFVFERRGSTLTMHSSFEAVGLTAAFATRLAEAGIPANVLAGYHHDHILVPVDRADDAIAARDRSVSADPFRRDPTLACIAVATCSASRAAAGAVDPMRQRRRSLEGSRG